MSPKPPDPGVRSALVDAAARVLVEEGPGALTTRRLATEVGTSTMAVYTYFEGMDELRRELRKEGFDRLAANLENVTPAGDSVEDITALGAAYFFNALANSHLYRFMFMEPAAEGDEEVGLSTFETLIDTVRRAIEAGRFSNADPEELATQLWVMAHGVVTLHLAACLTLQEAIDTVDAMGLNLFVAFGDDPGAARASIDRCRDRLLTSGLFFQELSEATQAPN